MGWAVVLILVNASLWAVENSLGGEGVSIYGNELINKVNGG
jgi:hypothetical protein